MTTRKLLTTNWGKRAFWWGVWTITFCTACIAVFWWLRIIDDWLLYPWTVAMLVPALLTARGVRANYRSMRRFTPPSEEFVAFAEWYDDVERRWD